MSSSKKCDRTIHIYFHFHANRIFIIWTHCWTPSVHLDFFEFYKMQDLGERNNGGDSFLKFLLIIATWIQSFELTRKELWMKHCINFNYLFLIFLLPMHVQLTKWLKYLITRTVENVLPPTCYENIIVSWTKKLALRWKSYTLELCVSGISCLPGFA